MPEPRILLHPLPPYVRCPASGAGLTFVEVRGCGDLYCCASTGSCRCALIHYRINETKTCGYAVVYDYGPAGEWTACYMPAAKG
jgi:hypothetical protein